MSDDQISWVSLREAQLVMGRCESSARRLIKKHGIRTKRVLTDRGQEMRICLEDVQELLPGDSPLEQSPGLTSLTRSNHRDHDGRVGTLPVGRPDDALQEFQNTMRAIAQMSASQVELLREIGDRLSSTKQERSDVVETQRQLSDSMANVNRAAKVQASTMLNLENRLKEQERKGARAKFALAAVLGIVLGAVIGAGVAGAILAWRQNGALGADGGPGNRAAAAPEEPADAGPAATDTDAAGELAVGKAPGETLGSEAGPDERRPVGTDNPFPAGGLPDLEVPTNPTREAHAGN